MEEEDLIKSEWENTGTSPTKNGFFDQYGYFILKHLCDPKLLYHEVPSERGKLDYWGNRLDQFIKSEDVESQVAGSISRYNHPQYKRIHSNIRLVLEKYIGCTLYNTYYYDRFYFPGQELVRHTDRPSCEISVSVHVSTNIKEQWPIWVKTPDVYSDDKKLELVSRGENRSVILEPGDGLIYKGCERPHWRDRMPGTLDNFLNRTKGLKNDQLYYHQIFFHYVLQDGLRASYAFDK